MPSKGILLSEFMNKMPEKDLDFRRMVHTSKTARRVRTIQSPSDQIEETEAVLLGSRQSLTAKN